jgi:1-deoxy-D-xylulose-5-phosphate synthase
VGEDGPTHHGAFDLSFLRIIPGLTVFVPKDEAELQGLLATALTLEGPSVIRYPRSAGLGVSLKRPIVPVSAPWVEILRAGSEAAVLALGPGTQLALQAAALLAGQGLDITVANVRRVHPLDTAGILGAIAGHRAVVTVEDNALAGGFGSALLELLADRGMAIPVSRIGLPDSFVPQGRLDILRHEVGLTPEAIADAVAGLMGESDPSTV